MGVGRRREGEGGLLGVRVRVIMTQAESQGHTVPVSALDSHWLKGTVRRCSEKD